ncbi:MAG: AAA family ATPase [Acidimicrobiia bacterium]
MSSNGTPGLPPPGTGPAPEEYRSRIRDEDRTTRKPLSFWDRSKILVMLGLAWAVFLWAEVVDNPIITFEDAVRDTIRSKWWILALAGLEIVRQVHYLISEHSAGWHRFWTQNVFGGISRRTGKLNDWNRFRIARALRYLFLLALLSILVGAMTDTSPVVALLELPSTFIGALPMILQVVFFMFLAVIQFAAIFYFLSRGGTEVYFPDDVKTRFSDVWGQDAVLERVKENIIFLENPEKVEAKGGYVPGGILLWGPPGTGKTLMAEAVAGETGRPYIFVDPGAFTNMFFGVGILKVKSLFRKLRKLAVRYGGVIVFFDEADSLGNRGQLAGGSGGPFGRFEPHGPWATTPACNGMSYLNPSTASHVMHKAMGAADAPPKANRFVMGAGMGGGGMGTLQALLTELSGLKKPRGFMNRVVRRSLGMRPKPPPKYRILVMMATNMPQALDEALLRPGRIDRIYRVGYPSKVGRIRTFEGYLAKVRHELTAQDIDKLATITPYHTGATIKDLVNEALVLAIRDGRDTITWRDIIKAKQLKAVGPPEDVEYITRERHAVAVHEACHAVMASKVQKHLIIDIATIEKGQTFLGFVAPIPPEERFTQWRTEFEADIMVSLASLAGERLFFDGDNSSGVRGDLENATSVAADMEGYWGMGSTIAFHDVIGRSGRSDDMRRQAGRGSESDLLLRTLGQRIERKLEELLAAAEQILRENRTQVLAVAHALEAHKTVTGEDIEAIIDGRAGPLVDGRVYATPEFAAAAEAYHAQALAAHKGHGIIDVPLPLFHTRPTAEEPVFVLPEATHGNGDDDRSPWARPSHSDE